MATGLDAPNFFILYGPSTNSVPLVHFYEAQANFAAALVHHPGKTGRQNIEVRRSAFVINYLRADTGKIVSQWPYGATPMATKLARRIAVKLS